MNQQDNPFQAPAARLEQAFPESGDLLDEARRVSAGEAIAWLSQGWEMFRQAPGTWIGLSVVFVVVMMVLGMIPIVNLALNLLIPVFIGGIMLGCHALAEGDELRIGHLFAGFSNQAGNLVLVGAIYLGGIVAATLVMAVIGGGLGFFAASQGSAPGVGLTLLIGLLAAVFIFPLAAAVWYAPALVLFHGMAPLAAMKASFNACLRNWLPFLAYGLVFLVLAVFATLPLGLGWLVLIPVTQASVYAGYRSMFLRA